MDEVHCYLRDTDMTLSHVTHELSDADQSVLTCSCRRRFGTGPSGYLRAAGSISQSRSISR